MVFQSPILWSNCWSMLSWTSGLYFWRYLVERIARSLGVGHYSSSQLAACSYSSSCRQSARVNMLYTGTKRPVTLSLQWSVCPLFRTFFLKPDLLFKVLYSAFYAIAYSPLITSYTIEILPFRLRAKGYTLFSFCVSASLVFNQYINPIAMKAIAWKYYVSLDSL